MPGVRNTTTGVVETTTGVAQTVSDTTPKSVDYQYKVSNFGTSTWSDSVGAADMSVNGMTASTFSNGADSVFGDGTDDDGFANGPQDIPNNDTFGVALTVQYSTLDSFDMVAGVNESTGVFEIRIDDGLGGNPTFFVGDTNGDKLRVECDNTFADGNPHTIIMNKTSASDANNVDIYVDDMSATTSTTVVTNATFSPADYSVAADMGFFVRNNASNGTEDFRSEAHIGIFEFNSQPYSEQERNDFVSRRPEV